MSLNIYKQPAAWNELPEEDQIKLQRSGGMLLMALGLPSVDADKKGIHEAAFRCRFLGQTNGRDDYRAEWLAQSKALDGLVGLEVNVAPLTRAKWLQLQVKGICRDIEWAMQREAENR